MEANAALGRPGGVRVLGSIADEGLDAVVVHPHRHRHLDHPHRILEQVVHAFAQIEVVDCPPQLALDDEKGVGLISHGGPS